MAAPRPEDAVGVIAVVKWRTCTERLRVVPVVTGISPTGSAVQGRIFLWGRHRTNWLNMTRGSMRTR